MARRTPNSLSTWRSVGGSLALQLAVPVLVVGLWWILSAGSTAIYYPSLETILSALRDVWFWDRFTSDALPSLWHLGLGYSIGVLAGVAVGIPLGLMPRSARAMAPLLETMRAVPAIALVPAALLILGIGATMQISVIATGAIWSVLLNTVDGVRAIDPTVNDVARTYGLRRRDRLFRLILPAASPQIVAGMRTAVSISVVTVVVSEIIGATNGIGFQLLAAQRAFDLPGMWAAMVLLGLLGYLLNVVFGVFERTVLGWHIGMMRTHG